jgi:dolichol kinase
MRPPRPENLARSLFHVCSGVSAVLVVQFVPAAALPWMAGAMAGTAWSLEGGRRVWPSMNDALMRLFGLVAHDHERERVNSGTWYATALFGLALLTTPLVCSLAVLVLGVADPAAAAIGRRFGRTRLAAGRSLEGSLAFVLAGTLASFGMLRVFYAALPSGESWALAGGAAVAGALAEALLHRVDDNLSIPLAAAAGAALVAGVF